MLFFLFLFVLGHLHLSLSGGCLFLILTCPALCVSCPCFFSLYFALLHLSAPCVPSLPVSFDGVLYGPVGPYANMPSPEESDHYLEGLVSTEGGWTRRGCQHILLS